jgi:hypothetical protein
MNANGHLDFLVLMVACSTEEQTQSPPTFTRYIPLLPYLASFPLLVHSRMTKRFAQPDADTRRPRLTGKIGGYPQLHDGRISEIHRLAPRSIGALLGTLDLLRFKPAPFFPFFPFSSI